LKLPLPKKLMTMPRPSKVRSILGSSFVEISFLGRESLGVKAFADALLIVPKTLATNSGHTAMDVVVTLAQETRLNGTPMGLDLETGEALIPEDSGIWDNYCVKKQILDNATVISEHFLLIDEIMRAGLATLKGQ